MRGRADVWAQRAVDLYFSTLADVLFGEVNNGGDLVELQCRAASDKHINFQQVRASRGKAVRAEPVSTLSRRGHVHLVGVHPVLEAQMLAITNEGYIPPEEIGPDAAPTPDRVDALVWLAHGLLDLSDGLPPSQIY
jgi:phage terminase large subunit-like protein